MVATIPFASLIAPPLFSFVARFVRDSEFIGQDCGDIACPVEHAQDLDSAVLGRAVED
ncbi:MAG: hypothetical protein ACP5XB_12805 [Isosphaeraceae bacterium]